jgi:hypothetical protein
MALTYYSKLGHDVWLSLIQERVVLHPVRLCDISLVQASRGTVGAVCRLLDPTQ